MKNILNILILLLSINLGSCNKSIDSKSESETISDEIVISFNEEKENFSEIEGVLFYKGNPLTGKVMRNLKITICCDEIKKREDIEKRKRHHENGEGLSWEVIDGMYEVISQEIITYKYGKKEGESSTSFDFDEFFGRVILMEGVYKDGKKNGKWKDYGYHTRYVGGNMMGEVNLVGGVGNYLNGKKVGEWKYYEEPWFEEEFFYDTEFYETRLDSIP